LLIAKISAEIKPRISPIVADAEFLSAESVTISTTNIEIRRSPCGFSKAEP
jgi:hypothetical protein